MLRTLYIKLSSALVLLFLLIGTALVLITRHSGEMYYQEITQRLNASIAMYIANEAPLIHAGKADREALQGLAHHTMIINPTIEVYLIAADGRVLAHDLGAEVQTRERVDLGPIHRFLARDADYPLRGDDPRIGGSRKIFSVSEVRADDQLEGYVYVILGGMKYEQLALSAGASDALTLSTAAVVACLLFGLGSSLLIFSGTSRRLRALNDKVDRYWVDAIGGTETGVRTRGDEIARLDQAFDAMSQRIERQLAQIRETDQTRRELITNISHDLRTPLTSMQGYIETLLLKQREISADQRQQYLMVAHNHGQRLGRLIADLFELARLDSNAVEPQLDSFSLAELVQDITQEFRLQAEAKSIELQLQNVAGECMVRADIRLIERVFQNLLENALRHTPHDGRITIGLDEADGGVRVFIADTGAGIADADLPHIFDRFFHTSVDGNRDQDSTGLGLAIVKRILDLHQSAITVNSKLRVGTSFSFKLPVPSPQPAYR